jgi:hypothetical protein
MFTRRPAVAKNSGASTDNTTVFSGPARPSGVDVPAGAEQDAAQERAENALHAERMRAGRGQDDEHYGHSYRRASVAGPAG